MAVEMRQGTVKYWGAGYTCTDNGGSWGIIAHCVPDITTPSGLSYLSLSIDFVAANHGLHFFDRDLAWLRVPASEYDTFLKAFAASSVQFWESHDMEARVWSATLSPQLNAKPAAVLSQVDFRQLSEENRLRIASLQTSKLQSER